MKQILALLLLTTGCKKAPEAFTADNATQDSSANEALIKLQINFGKTAATKIV